MDCPVCKDSAMIVLEMDEVEVDYCTECEGIWLDAGELEILLGDERFASSGRRRDARSLGGTEILGVG